MAYFVFDKYAVDLPYITVGKLKELLSPLEDTDWLDINIVNNFSIYRPRETENKSLIKRSLHSPVPDFPMQIGYLEFGAENIELYNKEN